ncbi:MAG: hypothetical protein LBB60_11100 [Desulfovibrio sp.]|jgi:hypothetical protein|nr:hypothetical protein [Desulfovibrio sp.]
MLVENKSQSDVAVEAGRSPTTMNMLMARAWKIYLAANIQRQKLTTSLTDFVEEDKLAQNAHNHHPKCQGRRRQDCFLRSSCHVLGWRGRASCFLQVYNRTNRQKRTGLRVSKDIAGQTCVAIDFDPQGNSSSVFGDSAFTGIYAYDFVTRDCRSIPPAPQGVTLIKLMTA